MSGGSGERRVAVTGLGVVCSLGRGAEAVWNALVEGRRGFGPLRLFDAGGASSAPVAEVPEDDARVEEGRPPSPPVAEVPAADPSGRPGRDPPTSLGRGRTRIERFLLEAAAEALRHARLAGRLPLAGFGVSLGSSNGGMLEAEAWFEEVCRAGPGRPRSASRALRLPSSCSTDALAAALGARGPRLTNVTACSASAAAIASAADLIRDGEAEGMIAGGGDALCRLTYAGFASLRLMDPEGCRPFDRGRKGLTLGEGAAILVLEDREAARARGARILAEVLHHGASCDAHHMTASHPEGRGMEAAMAAALARSRLESGRIGYLNAHGTATPVNDAAESAAIARVFPGRGPAVGSTKSAHGHLLGGSGALEAAITVLSLLHGAAPPTAGLREPDAPAPDSGASPPRPLDLVRGRERRVAATHAMSNSFGFGGGNVALVFASEELEP